MSMMSKSVLMLISIRAARAQREHPGLKLHRFSADTHRMQTKFKKNPVCETCGFDLWIPIAAFGVSVLAFYNDGRFPGRCILALKDHADHPHEIPDDVAAQFALDQKRAGAAIMAATGADRMNYAILGNTVSHVHSHLIPRRADEIIAARPIWESEDKQFKLPEAERDELIAAIRAAL